jgi:hypothetical protein
MVFPEFLHVPDYGPVDWVFILVSIGFAATLAWGDLRPMLPTVLRRITFARVRFGRISNRILLAWVSVSVLLMLSAVVYHWLGGDFLGLRMVQETERISYLLAVGVNVVLAFVLGVSLWLLGQWAAGDAKMFAALSLGLPLAAYANNYISWFPSFVLLFNTFVAMFAFLAVELLSRLSKSMVSSRGQVLSEGIRSVARKINENKLHALKIVVMFIAMFMVMRILRSFANEGLLQIMEINRTILFVILFVLFHPLTKFAHNKWVMAGSLAIIAAYLVYAFGFDPTGHAKRELVNIGVFPMSIIAFRFAYDAYLRATDEDEIRWSELRQGMLLSPSTVTAFQERKEFLTQLGELAPDGLDAAQVQAFREWFENNDPEGTLRVARSIPFGPALFVGALMTVWLQGLIFVY